MNSNHETNRAMADSLAGIYFRDSMKIYNTYCSAVSSGSRVLTNHLLWRTAFRRDVMNVSSPTENSHHTG